MAAVSLLPPTHLTSAPGARSQPVAAVERGRPLAGAASRRLAAAPRLLLGRGLLATCQAVAEAAACRTARSPPGRTTALLLAR
jgi:hypothetical protein